MGKFEKVLIASDFDGTLKNDDGIITDDVRSAIAYFISEGGYFTVCTGRTYQGFHLYDPSYINAPVLLTNGSMAYDYEKRACVRKRHRCRTRNPVRQGYNGKISGCLNRDVSV